MGCPRPPGMGWSLVSPADVVCCGELGVRQPSHVGMGDSLPPTTGDSDTHEATRPWAPRAAVGRAAVGAGMESLVGPNWTQWDPVAPDGTQWDPVGPRCPAAEAGWPGTIPRPCS